MERMTIKDFKEQSNIEIIESIMKMNKDMLLQRNYQIMEFIECILTL